jgi:hypothetical protein
MSKIQQVRKEKSRFLHSAWIEGSSHCESENKGRTEQADSYPLTRSREKRDTVSKRQQMEEGATRFSPTGKIQGIKGPCEKETTNGRGSNQILTD